MSSSSPTSTAGTRGEKRPHSASEAVTTTDQTETEKTVPRVEESNDVHEPEAKKLKVDRDSDSDFIKLVKSTIGTARFTAPLTLSGPIQWKNWQDFWDAFIKGSDGVTVTVQPTSVHLIAFFAWRTLQAHYGSYELQLILDAIIHKHWDAYHPQKEVQSLLDQADAYLISSGHSGSIATNETIQCHVKHGTGFVNFTHVGVAFGSSEGSQTLGLSLRYHSVLTERSIWRNQ